MSLTRCWVYDLDGVLLDSRDAVRRAYAQVGVDMPDDAWGKPWQQWCGILEHSRKVKVYTEMLERNEVPTLPPVDIVREQLACGERVGILTGAAHEAVTCFIQREELFKVRLLGWSATTRHKMEHLRTISGKERLHVTYVDDDPVAHIVPASGHFVQYTGQPVEQLKEDMKWIPSS